jgi:hypothetical protein
MEVSKNNLKDQDCVFSQAVRAGKRTYFFDVKRSSRNTLYMTITERKKIYSENNNSQKIVFEKHQLYLYKEDFEKFVNGLNDCLTYIKENAPAETEITETNTETDSIIPKKYDVSVEF